MKIRKFEEEEEEDEHDLDPERPARQRDGRGRARCAGRARPRVLGRVEPRTCLRKTIVMIAARKIPTRNRNRHVQARRRLTTSSSRRRGSSVPKRLGHGMRRRMTRSRKPRKARTTSTVQAIDQPKLQPGLPGGRRSRRPGWRECATYVPTRASRRSCDASATTPRSTAEVRFRAPRPP